MGYETSKKIAFEMYYESLLADNILQNIKMGVGFCSYCGTKVMLKQMRELLDEAIVKET